MPIYAYRCGSCGHAQDVLQKISDPVLTQCPSCGAASFKKQVTAAGFQLKGTGWYVTDFRGGNAGAAGGAVAEPAKAKEGEAAPAASPAPVSSGDSGASAPAPTPAAPSAKPSGTQ